MNRVFSYKNFRVLNSILMLILVIATLFPFLYMIAVSFSDYRAVGRGEVFLIPVNPNITSYTQILGMSKFYMSYLNTIFYTIVGTAISLVLTIICSYPLSKKHLLGGTVILKLIVFTMFFSGGLIPNFLLLRDLDFINKIWAILIPGAISAYNVMIMKTFFQGIPSALEDSARIDGLNDIGILVWIVIPLSKAILATIGLFVAVWIWNDWFMALIYLPKAENLRPVSLFLRNIVYGAYNQIRAGNVLDSKDANTVPETIQAATIVLISIPIIIVYPRIQKYFAKGMMIGSIKG